MTAAGVHAEPQMSRGVRAFLSGSAFSAAGIVLGGGFSMLAAMVFARWLRPEGFGAYSLALVVISFAAGLGTFGMDNTLARFCAVYLGSGQTGRIRSLVRFGLSYCVAFSLLLALAAWMWLHLGFHADRFQDVRALFAWIVIAIPVMALQLLALQTLLGLQLVKTRIVLEKIVQPLLRLALPFALLWWITGSLHAAVAGAVLGAALVTLASACLLVARLRRMPAGTGPPPPQRREWMSYSVPFVLYSLQNFVSTGMGIDVLLVALLASVGDSGIYAAAFRFTPVLVLGRTAIDYPFGPRVGMLYGLADLKSIAVLYKGSSAISLAWTLPFATLLALFSAPVMSAFFGATYAAGGTALAVLVLGFVADGATGCNTTLLSALGKSGLVLLNGMTGGVLTVIACFLLIPVWGITGAAWAVTLARMTVNLMATAEIWRLKQMHPFSHATWKLALAAAVAGLVGLLCSRQVVPTGTVLAWAVPVLAVVISYGVLLRVARISWFTAPVN